MPPSKADRRDERRATIDAFMTEMGVSLNDPRLRAMAGEIVRYRENIAASAKKAEAAKLRLAELENSGLPASADIIVQTQEEIATYERSIRAQQQVIDRYIRNLSNGGKREQTA